MRPSNSGSMGGQPSMRTGTLAASQHNREGGPIAVPTISRAGLPVPGTAWLVSILTTADAAIIAIPAQLARFPPRARPGCERAEGSRKTASTPPTPSSQARVGSEKNAHGSLGRCQPDRECKRRKAHGDAQARPPDVSAEPHVDRRAGAPARTGRTAPRRRATTNGGAGRAPWPGNSRSPGVAKPMFDM